MANRQHPQTHKFKKYVGKLTTLRCGPLGEHPHLDRHEQFVNPMTSVGLDGFDHDGAGSVALVPHTRSMGNADWDNPAARTVRTRTNSIDHPHEHSARQRTRGKRG